MRRGATTTAMSTLRTRTTGLPALLSMNSSSGTNRSTICFGESKRQWENENCVAHRRKRRRLEQLTVGAVNDPSRTREGKERGDPSGNWGWGLYLPRHDIHQRSSKMFTSNDSRLGATMEYWLQSVNIVDISGGDNNG